jgi:hypothetical protein
MMWPMGAAEDNDRGPQQPPADQGVLGNLPRTRPQRASARRSAARGSGAAAGEKKTRAAKAPAPPRAKARPPASRASKPSRSGKPKAVRASAAGERARDSARRRAAAARDDGVPRQGYESAGERVSGPVEPPGSAELLATAAEIVGEIARAGASTGERLVKDVLSRLPRP